MMGPKLPKVTTPRSKSPAKVMPVAVVVMPPPAVAAPRRTEPVPMTPLVPALPTVRMPGVKGANSNSPPVTVPPLMNVPVRNEATPPPAAATETALPMVMPPALVEITRMSPAGAERLPPMVSAAASLNTREPVAAVKVLRMLIWLAPAAAPDRSAEVPATPDSAPVMIVPVSVMAPEAAVSATDPVAEPPVVMRPEIPISVFAVRLMTAGVPVMLIVPGTARLAAVRDRRPDAETGPVTVSATPSSRDSDPPALRAPRDPMALVPVRAIDDAVPVSVPVVIVPPPPMVPALAISAREPVAVPPVVIDPGMVRFGAVSATEAAETGPVTDRSRRSTRDRAPAVTVKAPRTLMSWVPDSAAPLTAEPVSVPAVMTPPPLMPPALAVSETEPVTVFPVVIAPGIVRLCPVSATEVAPNTGPETVRSIAVRNPKPPAVAVAAFRVPIWLPG